MPLHNHNIYHTVQIAASPQMPLLSSQTRNTYCKACAPYAAQHRSWHNLLGHATGLLPAAVLCLCYAQQSCSTWAWYQAGAHTHTHAQFPPQGSNHAQHRNQVAIHSTAGVKCDLLSWRLQRPTAQGNCPQLTTAKDDCTRLFNLALLAQGLQLLQHNGAPAAYGCWPKELYN